MRAGTRSEEVYRAFDEQFCFGAGDETVGGDFDGDGIEFGFADEVGNGFGIDSAFDEPVQLVKLGLRGGFVEVHVELDSFEVHDMGDDELGGEARRIEAFFGEIVGCPVKQFLDRPLRHKIMSIILKKSVYYTGAHASIELEGGG